ncbi:hypothetical protein [Rhodosalinus sp. 5P4]|uniref:hypothetical protein n=1 Tax=Rhodosalinus sp. 5P4 TaxID=3239196 RepID=UPI0035260D7B
MLSRLRLLVFLVAATGGACSGAPDSYALSRQAPDPDDPVHTLEARRLSPPG